MFEPGGGYDMFPRRSSGSSATSNRWVRYQCKVEFADDSRTFFVHSEDEAIVGLSKDGSENTECGRRTSTTAASAIKYQCTNPKACVVGYYVKNSYKNPDSARVEEDGRFKVGFHLFRRSACGRSGHLATRLR